jgi:hypothetical protein
MKSKMKIKRSIPPMLVERLERIWKNQVTVDENPFGWVNFFDQNLVGPS